MSKSSMPAEDATGDASSAAYPREWTMAARKPLKHRLPGLSVWVSGLALAAAIALTARYETPRKRIPFNKAKTGNKGSTGKRPFGQVGSSDEPQSLQTARAAETGRGRMARSVADIPIQGWRDIAWRTFAGISDDRLLAVAAGVVFYGLLALFPAITALVSSYGLFADGATVGKHLAFAAALMPAGAFGIVEEQISRIAKTGGGQLGSAFLVGLLLAIWSANAGMKAMIDALNVIYDETEKRSFIRLNLLSLTMTLAALAFFLIAIGAVVVLPLVFSWLGVESWGEWAIALLRWPAMMIVIALALSALYRYGPSRRQAKWRWLSVGAVVATLLWIAGSALFSWYLSNFTDYNATYGSLGAGIGLMMWLWLTSISVLIGAELNAEIEHQTARDTTIGRDKPLGRRGAEMADTVGEAQD